MVDQKYLDKAEVLIEALPYIRRFHDKIIVVKYGGSAMASEELKKNVIKDVTLLKLVGFKPIIVHGGGKEISRWVSKVGMEPHFINGLLWHRVQHTGRTLHLDRGFGPASVNSSQWQCHRFRFL